jgi:hypothetical protein
MPLNHNMRGVQISGSGIFFNACILMQYSCPTHIIYSDTALDNYVACTNGGK